VLFSLLIADAPESAEAREIHRPVDPYLIEPGPQTLLREIEE